jgi:hypothetical protein
MNEHPNDRKQSSNRNAFYDIAGDLLVAAVVEPGSARVGVAGQALNVFERDALF